MGLGCSHYSNDYYYFLFILFIYFFVWLVSWNGIPTRVVLGSRGFNLCLTCEVCGNSDESIIHALHDCPGAKRVWTELGISSTSQEFYNLPLPE